MSLNYDRNSYITFNSTTGNDPLTDKLIGKLHNVPYSDIYVIQKSNEFRPDKIAAKFLANSNLFWVILEYNKLTANTDLRAGLSIKIPAIQYLNELLNTTGKTVSTNTIYLR
jgi:hypothetical protein